MAISSRIKKYFFLEKDLSCALFNTVFRVQEPRVNEACEPSYTQKPSAGLRAGGGENRLNVIRQTVPPANGRPEAETSPYTLLRAMLLS